MKSSSDCGMVAVVQLLTVMKCNSESKLFALYTPLFAAINHIGNASSFGCVHTLPTFRMRFERSLLTCWVGLCFWGADLSPR